VDRVRIDHREALDDVNRIAEEVACLIQPRPCRSG
jgi:hypothetical protein